MGCPDIDSCENRKSRCKNYIAGNRSYCFKPTLSLEPPRTEDPSEAPGSDALTNRIVKLLKEITDAHADRNSPDWNDCGSGDKDCAWCEDAKEIINELSK